MRLTSLCAIAVVFILAINIVKLLSRHRVLNLYEVMDTSAEEVRVSGERDLPLVNSHQIVRPTTKHFENATKDILRRQPGYLPKVNSKQSPLDKASSLNDSNSHHDKGLQRRLGMQKKPLHSEEVINPHPFTFTYSPSPCSQHAPDGKVFLLVLVACRPMENKDRRLIRETWGGIRMYNGRSILIRFLVGKTWGPYSTKMVANESALYGDIIQENFVDTYGNMTIKVLMGLKWASQMCPNATYVMNLDSDMFVNIFRLVSRLEEAPRSNFAEGRYKGISKPLRDKRKKWYTSVDLYPESTYPPYLNGPAYVMSGDLPMRIFKESAHVRYLPWDDVYIGIVMKNLGTRLMHGYRYEHSIAEWTLAGVLKVIKYAVATTVGHDRQTPLMGEAWLLMLDLYGNYTYSPPPGTRHRLKNGRALSKI